MPMLASELKGTVSPPAPSKAKHNITWRQQKALAHIAVNEIGD